VENKMKIIIFVLVVCFMGIPGKALACDTHTEYHYHNHREDSAHTHKKTFKKKKSHRRHYKKRKKIVRIRFSGGVLVRIRL
jgi:hypothetical protein